MKTITIHCFLHDVNQDKFLHADVKDWESNLDKIQSIIELYESDGITIDQGGDDDNYELDLPDTFTSVEWSTFGEALAKKLLDEVTKVCQ